MLNSELVKKVTTLRIYLFWDCLHSLIRFFNCLMKVLYYFLGAFTFPWHILKFLWLSVCTHVTSTCKWLNGFSWHLIMKNFTKICPHFQFWLRSDNINRHFTWKPTYVFPCEECSCHSMKTKYWWTPESLCYLLIL
jgi:hypothetical protein